MDDDDNFDDIEDILQQEINAVHDEEENTIESTYLSKYAHIMESMETENGEGKQLDSWKELMMDVEERAQSLSLWEQDLRQGVEGMNSQVEPKEKSLDTISNVDPVLLQDHQSIEGKQLPDTSKDDVAPTQNNTRTAVTTSDIAIELMDIREPQESDVELLLVQMDILQKLDREHEKNLRRIEKQQLEIHSSTASTTTTAASAETMDVPSQPETSPKTMSKSIQFAMELERQALLRQLESHKEARDRVETLIANQREMIRQLTIEEAMFHTKIKQSEQDLQLLMQEPSPDVDLELQKILMEMRAFFSLEQERGSKIREALSQKMALLCNEKSSNEERNNELQRSIEDTKKYLDTINLEPNSEAALLQDIASLHGAWSCAKQEHDQLLKRKDDEEKRRAQQKQERESSIVRTRNAVRIQTCWRRYIADKRYRRKKEATRKIQAVWKIYWTRVRHRRHGAAILIQKTYRGYRCRQWFRQCRDMLEEDEFGLEDFNFNEIIDSLPTDSFDSELDTYLQEDFTVARKLKSRVSSARGKSAARNDGELQKKSLLVSSSLRDVPSSSLSSSQASLASSKASVVEQAASEWGIHRQDVAESMHKNHRRHMGFLRKPVQRQILQDPLQRLKAFQRHEKRGQSNNMLFEWSEKEVSGKQSDKEKMVKSPMPSPTPSMSSRRNSTVSNSPLKPATTKKDRFQRQLLAPSNATRLDRSLPPLPQRPMHVTSVKAHFPISHLSIPSLSGTSAPPRNQLPSLPSLDSPRPSQGTLLLSNDVLQSILGANRAPSDDLSNRDWKLPSIVP